MRDHDRGRAERREQQHGELSAHHLHPRPRRDAHVGRGSGHGDADRRDAAEPRPTPRSDETGVLYVTEASSVDGRITVDGCLTTGTASLENVVFTPTGRYGASPDTSTTLTVSISGDLINESARPDGFVIVQFVEHFTLHIGGGTGSHVFRHPGADLGAVETGYVENFAWPGLRLADGDQLVIEDGNATPGVGLYVRRLELPGGVAQIASITGNGANLYYDPDEPSNAYLGGQTYPLGGGGAIVPIE